ncbi:MAG: gliding motility-associated C-terminal domain-containing protein [Bacteroidales bacterium]|jgi:gliding motility-associated-like protein|nr:gliding motility-associated C-terminal domain-containing protein [Bacteroidales bacterium]
MTRRVAAALMLLFAMASAATGTHNRAGEITYRQISELTFEVTVTTFTYTLSKADRPSLDIEWGDNSITNVARISETYLPNNYKKNVYVSQHTYPGPGVYRIVVQDPNRNYGVENIPNSVNVVFSISTILIVNSAVGLNSTPVLLNPPYDKAALGHIFIHNPAAYDPDGDSLSYKLTVCTKEDGKPILNYSMPAASNKFYVDSISGDMVWDTPIAVGIYNAAMEIEEWRSGIKIGVVVRDMQIEVYETDNNPPVTDPLPDLCVEAGEPVLLDITATDVDLDSLTLIATSGIFTSSACPASFTTLSSEAGRTTARLSWIPCHTLVRHQPYDIIIKAEDHNDDLQLVDIDNMSIKVLGPSPQLITAVPQGKYVQLEWVDYGTDAIAGFSIYRREGASSLAADTCYDGIPPSAGFVKVGYVAGYNSLSFTDTDNGNGLDAGVEYAYRIVAVYPNGTESKPSNEVVTSLIMGLPLITNVSIRNTDQVTGSLTLAWQKPRDLDTIPANGPYEYLIYRAEGIAGTDYQLIHTLPTTDLNDTVFIDTLINTLDSGWIYKIELYNNAAGNRFLIADPGIASSLYLTATPGDRKARFILNRNVPWINTSYEFFRFDGSSWQSVGSTNQLTWVDENLVNGTEYCYYARSTGGYQGEGTPKDLVNLSQRTCVVPVDNEPPCTPVLTVSSQCDSLYNTVRWTIEDPVCYEDVAGYNLFYKQTTEEQLGLLITFNDRDVRKYLHSLPDYVAGCYAISAFDNLGNESALSTMVCVDSCNFYEIPNVFTPNGDDYNDWLVAKASALVEKVEFRLFNRAGVMVFSTEEPKINWDGTYKGKVVPTGVYYYDCEVFERRISGLEQFHLNGFVHVITEKGAGPGIIEGKK